jgi:alanine racemase
MYGVYPGPEPEAALELEPAMTLGCRIADVRGVPAGFSVSYAGTFKTARPSRLAVLPVGYGCGYPRHASGKAQAIIRGRRAPLAGRITMNITVADVTDVPEARVGDTALLFGREGSGLLRVEEVARAAGSIPYEVLCNVGRCTPRLLEED